MAEPSKKTIGGFRILQEIQAGSGSQGTVYKAVCEDEVKGIAAKGTVVALKVMAVQDEDKSQWRKLEKRTRELAELKHPNVVRYYGCFSEPGLFNDVHVVVQEFLQGDTLKARLARFPLGLDVDEALRIASASLSGLIYTAGRGIVHRDIKPGNIFLCDNGDVKLIDFEIAKQAGGTTTSSAGNIRGSFDYMAPDFTDAEFHGDVKSDVFSMGVVLHELLTGKTPYQRLEGDDKQANFAFLSRWAHALKDGQSPIHVSSRIKRLLAHTEEVFAKSLAPRREDRYPDFESFLEGLKAIRFRNLRNGAITYQMLQFIGKGGFGEVFKARIRQTGQLVAIKHLLKSNYAKRFYREAKIMKKLRDPAFVQFVDFFLMDIGTSQEAFLAMAFLDGMPGSSLRDAIKASAETPLEPRDVFVAFERYARGLRVMHTSGIFHRDIKPSNLYYPAGHPERAAIMDLGIARDINGTATSGQVPGTLDYMPPEVVVSDSRGDGGMDVYALGLCLYEALTGSMGYPRLPSGSAAMSAFFERAKSKKPPTFDSPKLAGDEEILSLLAEMTNPDASKRIKDVSIVEQRLGKIVRDRYGNEPPPPPEPPPEPEKEEEGFADDAEAPTVALDPETRGTVATQAAGAIDAKAIEREKALYRRRRRALRRRAVRAVAVTSLFVIAIAAIGAGLFFGREPLIRRYADFTLDRVLSEYQSGNADAAQIKELAWTMQWDPETSGWLKLDAESFANSTNRLAVAKSMIMKAQEDDEARRRREEDRRLAIEKLAACRQSDGSLDEIGFAALEGWTLPESVSDDAEVKRMLLAIEASISDAVKRKLADEPPLTRRARLKQARELLGNRWAARVLSTGAAKSLGDRISEAESWSIGIVKNECDDAITVDGMEIAAAGSRVCKYQDGHPENGIVLRMGYNPVHLPRDFDGKVFAVNDETFVAKPVRMSFPALEDGVKCHFQEKEMSPRETVELMPGEYRCTYSKENCKPQEVLFSVRVNFATDIPGPGEWAYTDEYMAKVREEKERERIFLETPVPVAIPSLDEGVSCYIDGEARKSGSVNLKPGEHEYRYARRDSVDQTGKIVVKPGVGASLPPPAKWEKSLAAIERERAERLAALRKDLSDKCRELMVNEPIESRQNRLEEAGRLLKKAVSSDGILTEDTAKPIAEEIKSRSRWAVGRVHNRCGRDIVVGGVPVAAGKTELLVFKEGLPSTWTCRVIGYEPKDLSREFDGREISISENDLVPLDVKVSLPELDGGVACFFKDAEVRGSVSLKPGTYAFVYRRKGFQDQTVRMDVPLGEDCTLTRPGEWVAKPVKASFSRPEAGVVCRVDGDVVDSDLELAPGEHLCEYLRTDYETQEIRFTVAAAKDIDLPSPGEWVAGAALSSLKAAESAAKKGEWLAAEAALRRADVKSEAGKKRKAELVERISKQAAVAKMLDNAQLYFDGGLPNDALKCYYDVCAGGSSLSARDAAQAKEAYDMAMARNKALIDECNRMLQQGRTLTRSIDDLENERKQLIDWYRTIRSNASTGL